ncbi:hypothetical protein [Chitinimonas naiadis]
MITTHLLGFPCIGRHGELPAVVEQFRRKEREEAEWLALGSELRLQYWRRQEAAGQRFVTVGDFTYADQVLDTAVLLGALPHRFGFDAQHLSRRQYFELAHGNHEQPACSQRPWFGSGYPYLQPEFDIDSRFDGGPAWLFEVLREAVQAGFKPKVQLLGPLTLLRQARVDGIDALALLPRLVPAYVRLLRQLAAEGGSWVQLDEPLLGPELDGPWLAAFPPVYRELALAHPQILLASYGEGVGKHAELLRSLPVAGVHIDLVSAPAQLARFGDWSRGKVLSVGIVDGRDDQQTDLDAALNLLTPLHSKLGEGLWLASSPTLLQRAPGPDQAGEDIARQKLAELNTLARALCLGRSVCFQALEANRAALARSRVGSANLAAAADVQVEV